MESELENKNFIFGVNVNKDKAIQITRFRKFTNINGKQQMVRHADGENTMIMLADVMKIKVGDTGAFEVRPDVTLAFELPDNIGEIDQDKALEIVKKYLESKKVFSKKTVHYIGIVHPSEDGYQIEKPTNNTVENLVTKTFEAIRKKQKAGAKKANATITPIKDYEQKAADTNSYDITDVNTGEVLKLRKIENYGDGEYCAYIAKTPAESDIEICNLEDGTFKKIDFSIIGMTLDEIIEENDKEKIKLLYKYLTKLLNGELKYNRE